MLLTVIGTVKVEGTDWLNVGAVTITGRPISDSALVGRRDDHNTALAPITATTTIFERYFISYMIRCPDPSGRALFFVCPPRCSDIGQIDDI